LRPFPHVAEQQFTKRSVSIGIEKAKELSKTEKRERTSQKGFATPSAQRVFNTLGLKFPTT
jgi:hypothetical protein